MTKRTRKALYVFSIYKLNKHCDEGELVRRSVQFCTMSQTGERVSSCTVDFCLLITEFNNIRACVTDAEQITLIPRVFAPEIIAT